MTFDPLSEHFDNTIPEEVLQDSSWEPKLLPDLEQLDNESPYEDINDYDDNY